MESVFILVLLALINLPYMITSKKNWINYISFGFCLGLALAKLIYLTN